MVAAQAYNLVVTYIRQEEPQFYMQSGCGCVFTWIQGHNWHLRLISVYRASSFYSSIWETEETAYFKAVLRGDHGFFCYIISIRGCECGGRDSADRRVEYSAIVVWVGCPHLCLAAVIVIPKQNLNCLLLSVYSGRFVRRFLLWQSEGGKWNGICANTCLLGYFHVLE